MQYRRFGEMYDKRDAARKSYQWIPEAARAGACLETLECEDECPQKILLSDWLPMPPNARDLAATSVTWMDRFWDDTDGLLWSPGDAPDLRAYQPTGIHLVRERTWYALGLLMRGGDGDAAQALRALDRVLSAHGRAHVDVGDAYSEGHCAYH